MKFVPTVSQRSSVCDVRVTNMSMNPVLGDTVSAASDGTASSVFGSPTTARKEGLLKRLKQRIARGVRGRRASVDSATPSSVDDLDEYSQNSFDQEPEEAPMSMAAHSSPRIRMLLRDPEYRLPSNVTPPLQPPTPQSETTPQLVRTPPRQTAGPFDTVPQSSFASPRIRQLLQDSDMRLPVLTPTRH